MKQGDRAGWGMSGNNRGKWGMRWKVVYSDKCIGQRKSAVVSKCSGKVGRVGDWERARALAECGLVGAGGIDAICAGGDTV